MLYQRLKIYTISIWMFWGSFNLIILLWSNAQIVILEIQLNENLSNTTAILLCLTINHNLICRQLKREQIKQFSLLVVTIQLRFLFPYVRGNIPTYFSIEDVESTPESKLPIPYPKKLAILANNGSYLYRCTPSRQIQYTDNVARRRGEAHVHCSRRYGMPAAHCVVHSPRCY